MKGIYRRKKYLEVGERELHLIEQAKAALGAGAILLRLELCDLQLEMRDHGLGRTGARHF